MSKNKGGKGKTRAGVSSPSGITKNPHPEKPRKTQNPGRSGQGRPRQGRSGQGRPGGRR